MDQSQRQKIAVTDHHPVLGHYVLHYTADGGLSWVLRETRVRYERGLAKHEMIFSDPVSWLGK